MGKIKEKKISSSREIFPQLLSPSQPMLLQLDEFSKQDYVKLNPNWFLSGAVNGINTRNIWKLV